ncbi:hypothetical protein [Bradyrhizobium sp. USDA 4508]
MALDLPDINLALSAFAAPLRSSLPQCHYMVATTAKVLTRGVCTERLFGSERDLQSTQPVLLMGNSHRTGKEDAASFCFFHLIASKSASAPSTKQYLAWVA